MEYERTTDILMRFPKARVIPIKPYGEIFKQTAQAIPESAVQSISISPFRLPNPFHKKLTQLYPEEPLFATDIKTTNNMLSHGEEIEQEMLHFCKNELLKWVDESKLYPCVELH